MPTLVMSTALLLAAIWLALRLRPVWRPQRSSREVNCTAAQGASGLLPSSRATRAAHRAGAVLQIDNFGKDRGGFDHGEEVRAVMVDESGCEDLVQCVNVSHAEPPETPRYSSFSSGEEWLECLTKDTVEGQVEALRDVCEPLRQLLADPDSPCRVINLSLAQGTLYGLQPFYRQQVGGRIVCLQSAEGVPPREPGAIAKEYESLKGAKETTQRRVAFLGKIPSAGGLPFFLGWGSAAAAMGEKKRG